MPSSLSSEHTNDTFRPPPDRGSDEAPLFESGIPPGGTLARTLAARGEAHAQLALAACARSDANRSARRTRAAGAEQEDAGAPFR